MGSPPEPATPPPSSRRARAPRAAPSGRRARPRPAVRRATYDGTQRVAADLVRDGAVVSLIIADVDRGVRLAGIADDLVLPLGSLSTLPLLVEVAAAIEAGLVSASALHSRPEHPGGIWGGLRAPALSTEDLAVLAAATADPAVGQMLRAALPTRDGVESTVDGASAGDLALLLSDLVSGRAVSPGVSARVSAWLLHAPSRGGLTGLDVVARGGTAQELALLSRAAQSPGLFAESGVVAGSRAGAAYALIVQFDESSIAQRMRVIDVFRTLGAELLDDVY